MTLNMNAETLSDTDVTLEKVSEIDDTDTEYFSKIQWWNGTRWAIEEIGALHRTGTS